MKTKEVKKATKPKHIGIVRNDAYLEPFEEAIKGRHEHAQWKLNMLTKNGKKTLSDFANGHNYYGLHKKTADGCSESGLLTQQRYSWWAISTIGKKMKNMKHTALKALATGN